MSVYETTRVAKKKMSGWLKWIYIIGFGFCGLIFALVFFAKSLEPVPEITTWEQWVKHKGYLQTFSKDIILKKDALSIYIKANDYSSDSFYRNCKLEGCIEYRGFIRTAREVAADNILTPKEQVELAESLTSLNLVIKAKDSEFKIKFSKQ
jgi:hypothetical protein